MEQPLSTQHAVDLAPHEGGDAVSLPLEESRRWRHAHFVLGVSMFVMGACGMIYEYALGVLGNNLMGSSREQIFVIIGLMMFAMGIGASWQQRIRRDLIDGFLWVELALGLLGGTSTLVIFAAFAYTESYRLIMYGFALVIGMLIGCEIPLLIRINTRFTRSLPVNLSSILSMDYVGSLVGALLFTYVLLTRLSMEKVCLILGSVNTALAVVGLVFFWPLVRRKHLLLMACGVVLAGLVGVACYSGQWMARLEQRCFEDPIIHRQTTPYQHLVLTQRGDRTRLYIDGHLQFSSRDEHIYHEMLVHVPMTIAAARGRVLILGGGDGLALREVLRYGDVRQVTLVDIDPAMIELAATHPEMVRLNQAAFQDARVASLEAGGVRPGEQVVVRAVAKGDPLLRHAAYDLAEVHVLTLDADQFLQRVDGHYDVILVDFPDPRSVELAKLYSVPFYRSLARHLAPGGLVSVQSTSPVDAPLVYRCVGVTLAAADFRVLPYHAMVPSFGDWGWHLAWHDGTPESARREALTRLESLPVVTRYVTPDVIRAALVFGKGVPDTRHPVVPNTRWRPVMINYHVRSYH